MAAPTQPAAADPAPQQQQGEAPVAGMQPAAQGAVAPQPQQPVAMMPQQPQQLLQMMGSPQPVPGAMVVAAPGQAAVPGQTTQSGQQQPQLLFNPAAAVMQQPGMSFTPPNLWEIRKENEKIHGA